MMGFVTTTTSEVSGHKIQKYCGVVGSEVVMGANLFRDFFAAFRDIVGGRSRAYEEVLVDARTTALEELKVKAKMLNATALVGVKFDYTVVGRGGSILVVCATGTAVVTQAEQSE